MSAYYAAHRRATPRIPSNSPPNFAGRRSLDPDVLPIPTILPFSSTTSLSAAFALPTDITDTLATRAARPPTSLDGKSYIYVLVGNDTTHPQHASEIIAKVGMSTRPYVRRDECQRDCPSHNYQLRAVYEADHGKKAEKMAHIPLREKYGWYPRRRCRKCKKHHTKMFYLDNPRQLQDVEEMVAGLVALA